MAGADGREERRLSYAARLRERPWDHDFYQALRRLEALHPESPRLGEARRPQDEPIRLGQLPELTFAPANLAEVEVDAAGRLRLLVRFLGFWGPQGALPTHLTEFARERKRSHDDPTIVRFADLFHHRLLLLFYRAWRQAQPTASRDRPASDRYRTYVGALFGHGPRSWHGRDSVADDAKRFFSGILARAVRNADGLGDVLTAYLRVPVRVEPFAARRMRLPRALRSRLGQAGAGLGAGAVAGASVLDAQHHVRLVVGPMRLHEYEQLLPPGPWNPKLRDWIREYTSEEFEVRVSLRLAEGEAPPARLGATGRLGWTSWLGRPPRPGEVPGVEMELSRSAH